MRVDFRFLEAARPGASLPILLFACLGLAGSLAAQGPIISFTPGSTIHTTAGNGAMFFSGDGSLATSAALAKPNAIAVDSGGNLYIADSQNHRVRRVDTSGTITTFAGDGVQGFSGDGGPATSASLDTPMSVAVDAISGKLYIADNHNNVIRVVSNGTIATFAGDSGGKAGYSGDGGSALAALLSGPRGVITDGMGNVFIADTNNHAIRMVSNGVITTVAGNGQQGFFGDNGPAGSASLDSPGSVFVDSSGNILIPDTRNHRIRKVSAGQITTIAGSGAIGFLGEGTPAVNAAMNYPLGVGMDSLGNIYIADANNERVRRVNPAGAISTVAGTGDQGFFGDGGSPLQSSLDTPSAVLASGGHLVIVDRWNQRTRQVDAMLVTFADQMIGTVSPPQTVTVSNAGGGTLTLTSIALGAGPFSLAGGSCGTVFPINLAAGADCTVNMVFNPVSVGAASNAIQFTDNAPGSPHLISVAGNGIQDATTTVLATSQGTTTYGSSITLTATVAPATTTTAPPLTGSVTFADGTTALGTVPLASGSALFSTHSLTAGNHTLAAAYTGDSNYHSSSTSLAETVSKAVPTVVLTVQPNPPASGQSATFTATVTSSAGVPTGTVTFTANTTSLGTSPVNSSGVAALATTLGPGAQAITATYNGDTNFATASSPVLNEGAGFTLSITPSSASVTAGQSASFTVSVAASGGFNGSVTLSCSNLPFAATCIFSPASLAASNASVSSSLTLQTALSTGVSRWEIPRSAPPRVLFLPASLLLMFCVLVLRTRPMKVRTAAFAVLFFGLLLASGCASAGGGGSGQKTQPAQTTPPGNYSITVNATPSGQGAQSQSVTLSVTVTP